MDSSVKGIAGKRVFVGLSGGVDSAATAALLQKAGADITGVFIRGWYPPGLPCTWGNDRRDAMRVAARLHIPFLTLDASAEYKKSVIDYLVSEYGAGRTPNPDIMCNRDVKFGAFYDFARAQGADFIATGHYARIEQASDAEYEEAAKNALSQQHFSRLLRGTDASKDQSYFLWAVPKEVLPHVLFPLGGMDKSEVRSLAREFNLPVADKKDSQGICFLGSVSIEEFLRSELKLESGEATDEAGNKVGMHSGALAYTLGERARLTHAESGPWYVVAKDIEKNRLIVSKTAALSRKHPSVKMEVLNANWFTGAASGTFDAQYRYHGPVISGRLDREAGTFTPAEPIGESVSPGQSLVFYHGEELVGGGIIR